MSQFYFVFYKGTFLIVTLEKIPVTSSSLYSTWLVRRRTAFILATYGCPLWCSMYHCSYRKMNVAYNDAFGHLLHEPRWCSTSQLFAANNVSSFAANIRKLVYSLWRSLSASDNVLINGALRSDILARSPVFRRWHNILF